MARRLADGWREEAEALKTLDVAIGRVAFALRDSHDGPLTYAFPLETYEKQRAVKRSEEHTS